MQNRKFEAEESFKAALTLDPSDWQSLVNYGVLLVRHIGDDLNGMIPELNSQSLA
jgi:hypothetical protein